MKKSILYVLFAIIFSWSLLTLSDYIDETYSDDTLMTISLFISAIFSIIYLIFETKLYRNTSLSRIKFNVALIGVWEVGNFVVVLIIDWLMAYDKWIVYQHTEGFENLLNGIEYPFMMIFNMVIPIIIICLWNLIMWVKRKFVDKKVGEERKNG